MQSSYPPRTTLNSLRATLSTDQPLPTPKQMSTQSGSSNQPNATTNYADLVKAIDMIVESNLPNKVKLHRPDPFDSSDPQKLHMFLLQCKLNFRDWKDLFQDNSMKVNYCQGLSPSLHPPANTPSANQHLPAS